MKIVWELKKSFSFISRSLIYISVWLCFAASELQFAAKSKRKANEKKIANKHFKACEREWLEFIDFWI
jgi:hypothetical protein